MNLRFMVIYETLPFFPPFFQNEQKATQTIFVMTKVYIFAIAHNFFALSQILFFLYRKKNWKILSQKKKKNLKKDLKMGKAEIKKWYIDKNYWTSKKSYKWNWFLAFLDPTFQFKLVIDYVLWSPPA